MSVADFRFAAKKFFEERGLKNKDVAKVFDVSEGVMSRYLNTEEPSRGFLDKVKVHYPELYAIYQQLDSPTETKILDKTTLENKQELLIRLDNTIMELMAIKKSLSQM